MLVDCVIYTYSSVRFLELQQEEEEHIKLNTFGIYAGFLVGICQ